MREKIKILEGIWGDGGSSGEAGDPTPILSASVQRERGSGSQQHGGSKEAPGGRHADDGSDTAGGAGDMHGDDPSVGDDRPGRDDSPGDGNEGAPGRDDDAEATNQGLVDADAGVDAWLISYNRRLKNELERLRERTRQAEDR